MTAPGAWIGNPAGEYILETYEIPAIFTPEFPINFAFYRDHVYNFCGYVYN